MAPTFFALLLLLVCCFCYLGTPSRGRFESGQHVSEAVVLRFLSVAAVVSARPLASVSWPGYQSTYCTVLVFIAWRRRRLGTQWYGVQ